MDYTRNEIYLAALLHDIGKFYQRADEHGLSASKHISPEIKALESVFCPKYKGKTSHKHVIWTAQFFHEFESHFRNLLRNENPSIDALLRLAAGHHLPDNKSLEQRIIQKADHYSSGADRSSIDDAWKDAEEENDLKWDNFRRIKMRSIFEGITLKEKDKKVWTTDYQYKLPMREMILETTFFPSSLDESLPDYQKLWNGFTSELKFIQSGTFRTFSETLLALLRKYTGTIPSSTQHLPDVSLYDHAKTTAAFASCLYTFISENNRNDIPGSQEKPFLLIGGDLSGIQKFIYGIIAKGAAKNLKGRSFYLQLLIDNIVQALLDELGLNDACIVYSSGGGFYLLAPNVERVKIAIGQFSGKIEKQLFEFHKTDLFLSIAFSEFGEEEIFFDKSGSIASIGDVWSDLSSKLSERKGRRFELILTTDYPVFFMPGESGGINAKDAITGEEITGKKEVMDGHEISHYTYLQIQLGERLRNTDYWVVSKGELNYFPQEAIAFEPIGLGYFNYFVPSTFFSNSDNREKLRKSADKVRAISVNNLDFLESPQKGIDNIYGFEFYGGNKFPESKWFSMPKTFEEIAGVEFSDKDRAKRASAPNLVRMGILRMDVDNLGTIFKRGLSADKRSFSRYSVLSRSLDYFFKGYLNIIWAQEKYHHHTQIIYSGGDDLFLVGKWDLLIEMAIEINKEFRSWTCHNPEITLSGGIAFVYPKFPILKASGMSEEEEKYAKSHEYFSIGKNSISLFAFPFNWDSEFEYVLMLKNEIKGLLENNQISQGFPSAIYNLMEMAQMIPPAKKDERYRISNYKSVWMTAYNFKRAMQRNKDEPVKSFFEKWIGLIYTGVVPEIKETKYHPLQLLAVASRWASFELRNH
jgi:CRISPR-associated protein Csm1